ncbi:MAG: diguanylate cyclase, partial [Agathobacter sp.]
MQDTKGKVLDKVGEKRDDQLQLAIMRVVSELNQDKFLEYDCETDVAILSMVENGRFVPKEVMNDYLSKGDKMDSRIAEEDRALYHKEFNRCLKKPMNRVFDIRFINAKGEARWHRMYLVSVADGSRKVIKIGARLISIHNEKIATDMLRTQAERDSLTGVYNHKTYEDLSKDIIRKNSDGILFLMLDIDDFKQINDIHGHYVGDTIVKQVGEVLQLVVKDYGIAGRIGGDEFSVCLANIWDKETALAVCIRIKDALKRSKDGVEFSVSIGAARSRGRICTYEELYYEADEALYFVKDNGKNQILFTEEIRKKQQDMIADLQRENILTEEEIAMDEMVAYRVVTDPITKKILYINRPAREKMGISLRDAQKIPCYEFLMGRCKECDVCELHSNRVRALSEEESQGLKKYIPDGRFVLQSGFVFWKGQPARMTTILDVCDKKQMEAYFQSEWERKNAINTCWDIIHNTDSQNVDYTEVLRVLNEYYDADCCAIISKEDEDYKDVYEFHRNSAEALVEGIYASVEEGVFPKMEVLIDEEGYMRRRHIEQKLLENPDLIEILEKSYVHNTLGMKLARRDNFVGILLIINPRHHTDECTVLKRIGVFFATDLLRKSLSENKEYEMTHDMLTCLWSRAYFTEWQAKFGPRFKNNFGVFTADIYGLGRINREFGYENGNKRLVEVA